MKEFPLATVEITLWKRVLTKIKEPYFGVEIGCLYGDSANVILNCSPFIHLTSIDPFIPDSMESSLVGSFDDSIEKNKEFFDNGRFSLVQDYSWNIVKNYKDNSLDFIFIDGDHTYSNVLRDFKEWTPKLKVNGLLFMHDSRMSRFGGASFHEGPSRVAKEFVFNKQDEWEIVDEAFSLTCARKLK